MTSDLDISILIPTYNWAKVLFETLESMTRLDRDGLLVEFIVVDNNSETPGFFQRFRTNLFKPNA